MLQMAGQGQGDKDEAASGKGMGSKQTGIELSSRDVIPLDGAIIPVPIDFFFALKLP